MPRTADLDELREHLRIDRDALDDALIEQPDLLYQVSEQYTLAISRRDEFKLKRDEVRATVAGEIRDDDEAQVAKHGGKKMSVDAVGSSVAKDDRVREAEQDVLEATTEAARWSALKEAFADRSHALKSLTQLFASNYFTRSTGSSARRDAVERDNERTVGRAAESRTKLSERPRQRPRE